MNKNLLGIIIVFGLLSIGTYFALSTPQTMPEEEVEKEIENINTEKELELNNEPRPCTMEAKICPDGSAVGRTGPNCEFAPCPGAGLANPASVYCVDNGGILEIRQDNQGGQFGVCIFPGGASCEEWSYYRGECFPSD